MDLLRIGSLLAPSMEPVHRTAAAAIAADLEIAGLGSAEFAGSVDYSDFCSGAVEVAFVCGLAYVALADFPAAPEPVAAPVLSGPRYMGRPIYFSDVVVKSGSSLGSFDELAGSRFAYNERLSQSGAGVVLGHLARTGRDLTFFSEVIRSGGHANSIALVLDGQADAAAIDSQLLEFAMREDRAQVAGLEVIDQLGPSTIQPVTVAAALPQTIRQSVVDSLLSLGRHPAASAAMVRCGVGHFTPITPADYNDIRTMAAAAQKAGLSVD